MLPGIQEGKSAMHKYSALALVLCLAGCLHGLPFYDGSDQAPRLLEVYRGVWITKDTDACEYGAPWTTPLGLWVYEAKQGIDRVLDHADVAMDKLDIPSELRFYGPANAYIICRAPNTEGCFRADGLLMAINCDAMHGFRPAIYDADGLKILSSRIVAAHELIRLLGYAYHDGADGSWANNMFQSVPLDGHNPRSWQP